MPPEPLPWDRKDFFRERRHSYDRPPEPMSSVGRWRDSSHGSSRSDFGRWGFPSDFRRPQGHGRQGGWHSYSEDFVHGYGAPRSCDRFVEEPGFRPYGPRGDNRYTKNFRENRGSYSHKDWRSHSWDQNNHHGGPSNSVTSRLRDAKDQRIAEDSSVATPSHSNPTNTTSQPNPKVLPDKTNSSNGPVVAQRSEKENVLGNTDWKPIRWSRSAGLTSRGSSFSHSSSSKSLPAENSDVKSQLPMKIPTPSESPSGDAPACSTPTGSMEDISSRKKPRLGWGEGLAKYEKKRVVGSGECMDSSDAYLNCVDSPHSPALHLAGQAHSGSLNLSDCTRSPAPSLIEHMHSPAPSLTGCLHSPTPDMTERLHSPASNYGQSPASNSAVDTLSPVAKWADQLTHSPSMYAAEPIHSPAQNLAEPMHSPVSNFAVPAHSPASNLAEISHSPSSNLPKPMQSPPSNMVEALQSPASNMAEAMQAPASNMAEAMQSPASNLVEAMQSPASNLAEAMHSPASNLADKSPLYGGFDCVSPATPSSFACSSSPGLQEKPYVKVAYIESDANKSSPVLLPRSHSQVEGAFFNQENAELNTSSNLSGLLNELLQSIDNISLDSGSLNYTALNKLLLLKGEILNTLEFTESEIDSRENELRLLRSKSENTGTCPESSSSLSVDSQEKPHEESLSISKPRPLICVSSGDAVRVDVHPSHNIIEDVRADIKDEDVDSPGSATSKRMESPSGFHGLQRHAHRKDICPDGQACVGFDTEIKWANRSSTTGEEYKISDGVDSRVCQPISFCKYQESDICTTIYLSNKETASRASEVFCKLLPHSNCYSEQVKAVDDGCEVTDLVVVERFLEMKQTQRFKERILSLKYKAFLHLWKEELRMLSIKKLRSKSLRRVESSSRSLHSGFKRHRSSIRSRFGSQGSNSSLVPASKAVNITSKVLADPQIKVYRDELKMPALFLDVEKKRSQFLSDNGLVQDPLAAEKERSLINPWTEEEKEVFLDKLATFGKDFVKISSFIDHKTTADCVEFYYKNHKSECFRKTKKKADSNKQEKSAPANRYLMTSGKKWNREMNAASLDMLGAASAIIEHVNGDLESVKHHPVKPLDKKYRRDGDLDRSSSFEVEDEREAEAADVLAGICGSLSSEAMSSCITSSVDPTDGIQEWKHQRTSSSEPKRPPTPEVTQNEDDDTCSDESCGDVDTVDWTDEEKLVFVQAFSSFGKDFVMISQCVGTKSREQCKVFFSKARKCLGLDSVCPGPLNNGVQASGDVDGGRSDTEGDACIVENDSAASSDKSGGRMDENIPVSPLNMNNDGSYNIDLHDDEMGGVEKADPVKPEDGSSGMELHDVHTGRENVKEISEPTRLDGDVDGEVENRVWAKSPETSNVPVVSCRENEQKIGQHIVSEPAAVINSGMTSFPTSYSMTSDFTVGCNSATENGKADRNVPSSSYTACGSGREERIKRSASASDLKQTLLAETSGSDVWRKDLSVQVEAKPIEVRPLITSSMRRTDSANAQPLQVYFKKCNRAAISTNSVCRVPPILPSTRATESIAACHTSDTDKPSRSVGVKLFGQILSKSSSVEKSSSSMHDIDKNSNGSNNNYHSQPRPRSANGLDLVSTSHEMERDHFYTTRGNGSNGPVQSFPAKSYGFWDGTRIRTGFSALPDSAALLAKYPSAFANSPSPSLSNVEPLGISRVVNDSEPSLMSRVGLIQGEMCSTNGKAASTPDLSLAYPTGRLNNRNVNGFEVVSSLQQIKMNMVRGGDMNGAAATVSCVPGGLTDPVTALKLHYARTQTVASSSQPISSGGREEVTWKGQNGQQQHHHGDLGR